MTPIDLLDYTDTTEKVHPSLLNFAPQASGEIQPPQIISAYLLDLMAIASGFVMTAMILDLAMTSLMLTPALQIAFEKINYSSLIITLMPLVTVGYFFFSFFFNQGQSWGMSVQKIRISIPTLSYRSSLVWSLFSGAALLTLGLSAITHHWLSESGLGNYQVQDHLYAQLTEAREHSPINLLEEISKKSSVPEVEVEEFYSRAA